MKLKSLKFIIIFVSIIAFVFTINTCYAVDLNLSTDLTTDLSSGDNSNTSQDANQVTDNTNSQTGTNTSTLLQIQIQ